MLAALTVTGSAAAGPTADWTSFLSNPLHSSVSADATVTPATVAGLSQAWSWTPPIIAGSPARTSYSTPDVVNDTVYEGSTNGAFYALSLSTGNVLWTDNLGAYQTKKECEGFGFVASPAAANDPTTGKLTIYDAGGDGYLYALDAATGTVNWKVKTKIPSKTQNNYMNWSSPTIANGSIYLGIASDCDDPLIQGGLMKFSQSTGNLQHTYHTLAGTPAADCGRLDLVDRRGHLDGCLGGRRQRAQPERAARRQRIDRGSQREDAQEERDLAGPTADLVPDGGFGASVVPFTATIGGVATPMIGDCNKNGKFYAIDTQTMTEVWQINVDVGRGPCTAGAIWDGTNLIVSGQQTKIHGVKVPGSIRSLNPATGATRWQTALGAAVLGTPSESGGGVIAVATWDSANPNALYSSTPPTGTVLRTIPSRRRSSRSRCRGRHVVTATLDGGLIAYRSPPGRQALAARRLRPMTDLTRRLAVARGDEPADLVVRGGRVLSVYTREWLEADVAVCDGWIAGVGEYRGRETLDAGGRYVVPGLIDAHLHLESSLLLVDEFAKLVLPFGTTSVVADPHEIANVLGTDGVHWLADACAELPLDVFFMAPSCVPASRFESPRRALTTGDLEGLLRRRRVLGLAEMMNFPGVIAGDPDELAKLGLDGAAHVDGHAPGVLGGRLQAYAAAGIGSDHEATTPQEGRERLRAGMWLLIREASGARNLDALLPLVHEFGPARIAFCTDDREPGHIAREGHVNSMVRRAVETGVDARDALAMASCNAAAWHGLGDRGAIAPGRRADLLVLPDLERFVPDVVLKDGRGAGAAGRAAGAGVGAAHRADPADLAKRPAHAGRAAGRSA